MADIIIGSIIVAALALAIRYIVNAKKSGVKCIGCPDGATCSSKSKGDNSCGGCSCGCHSDAE